MENLARSGIPVSFTSERVNLCVLSLIKVHDIFEFRNFINDLLMFPKRFCKTASSVLGSINIEKDKEVLISARWIGTLQL